MAPRWLLVAPVVGCAAPAPELRPPPAAASAPASASAKAPQAPAEVRVRLVPAPGGISRARVSPSTEKVLVPLKTSPGDAPVVALVRGGDTAASHLFEGAEDGMFADENKIVLKRGKRVIFASEDGAELASFEADWPPVLNRGLLSLQTQAPGLILADTQGTQKASLPGVPARGVLAVAAENNAVAVFAEVDREYEVRVYDPAGKKLLGVKAAQAVASTNGRTLAALVTGHPEHTVLAIDVATGQQRVTFALPAVQTMLGGLPILAVDALGTTIVAGVGERLFIADVAAKRVRQLPGLPSDKGTAQLSGIRFTPQGDLCLFRTDTNTRRSASCEASHLIEVRAGRRRAMSLLDACVEVGDSAARVSFPPPPRGRRFIEGSFFGPRGICAVGVTPDGSHAVRLETDAAGTALSLIGRHRATPDTRDEVALPKGESPLTDAHFDLSPRGDRVALWRMGDLLLIDTAKRSVLAQRTNSNPGEFTHEGKLVFDRYQDELLMDRDGKAAFAWPDKDSQDAAAVRCVVDGKLQRCAAP